MVKRQSSSKENTAMKKTYIKPEMMVVKLQSRHSMLLVSKTEGPFSWDDNLTDDDR